MRIRTIKPEFFRHGTLTTLPPLTRILFIGLWCLADCKGRLKDDPRTIKLEVLPADDWNVDAALDELAAAGFIIRYTKAGMKLIQIPAFEVHQRIQTKESQTGSRFPGPDDDDSSTNGGGVGGVQTGGPTAPPAANPPSTPYHHSNGDEDSESGQEHDRDDYGTNQGRIRDDSGTHPGRPERKGKERKGREHTQPRARDETLPWVGEAFATATASGGNPQLYAIGRDRLKSLVACMKRVSPDNDVAELGVTFDTYADQLARREKWFPDPELEAILTWCKNEEFGGWNSAAIDPAMFVSKFDRLYSKYQVQNPRKRQNQKTEAQSKPRLPSAEELATKWSAWLRHPLPADGGDGRTWPEIVALYGEQLCAEVCARMKFDPQRVKRVRVSVEIEKVMASITPEQRSARLAELNAQRQRPA